MPSPSDRIIGHLLDEAVVDPCETQHAFIDDWDGDIVFGIRGLVMAFPARILVIAISAGLLASCSNPHNPAKSELGAKPVYYREVRPSHMVVGNYCGPGNRHGSLSYKPVDRVDAACLEHDVCYIQNRNRIDCNVEFVRRLDGIIADPKADKKLVRRARLARSIIKLPVFQMFPDGLLPPRKQDVLKTRYRSVGET